MIWFLAKGWAGAVLMFLSATFSVAETALMSLSRIQLNRLGKVHPGRLAFWESDPDRVLAVLLLGTNLTHVGLGVLATSLALDMERLWNFPFRWGGWLLPLSAVLLTILFGEILPKVIARNFSEPLALRLAGFARRLTRWLGPLVQGILSGTGLLLSRLSKSIRTEQAQWNVSVIRILLARSSLAPSLRSVLNNLLDFGNLPVARILVPREEIFAVDLSLPKPEFIERVLSSGYSRVPVYRGSLDNMLGIVYSKDLLASWRSETLIVLEDIIRPALRVPASVSLAPILREFRQGRHHMALVFDRNHRVEGLVTLQDTLEAIVGEIAEEPELSAGSHLESPSVPS